MMSLLKIYLRGPSATLPALAAFAMLAACSNKTEVDLSVCDGRSASAEELGYDNTCDPIVPEVCAFPFPNDFYTRPVKETETGKCVSLKSGFFGATDPSVFNRADGFSASSTILFQLPDGIDKGFPKPTDEGIASSIETSSKTIVLDAETGELIPHFAEEDKNAPTAETRALTIRPVIRLKDGHRYIVAVRGVEDSSGSVIAPSEAFLALRDGKSSDSASIEERRDHYKKIFDTLEDAGIERDSLQLAWDFTTASTESNTRMLLHMRDDGLERVRAEGHPYTITSVAGDCSDLPGNGSRFSCDPLPGDYEENIAYRIEGTFRVPNYMTAQAPGGSLILDERGLPIVNEEAPHHDQSFAMLIPRSALEEPKPLLQYGHGLFGAESQIYAGNFRSLINEHGYIYSLKIADQRLDKKLRRAGLRAPDSLGKVRCPTIEEIVAIDHRNDDISEAHAFKRHRRGLGLTGVHVASGIARIDGAESAATCTRLSKDHDGGCAGAPALEDIRTARLGADRMKIETVEPFLYRLKARLVLSAGET